MAWQMMMARVVADVRSGRILEAVGRVTKEEVDRLRTYCSHMGRSSFSYAYAWLLDQSRDERERGISTGAHSALLNRPLVTTI
jgi:translation elongation factor EF-1alpha